MRKSQNCKRCGIFVGADYEFYDESVITSAMELCQGCGQIILTKCVDSKIPAYVFEIVSPLEIFR